MSAVDSSLTRQQAISEAKKIWADSEWCSEGVVKILEALGVVRFKPTVKYEVCPPKQAIKDTSSASTAASSLHRRDVVRRRGDFFERQAHALRASAVEKSPPCGGGPCFGEDDFEGEE